MPAAHIESIITDHCKIRWWRIRGREIRRGRCAAVADMFNTELTPTPARETR